MRWVVYAMLAERRFDRQHHTAQRATDALDLLSDQGAKPFRMAADRNRLSEVVAGLHFGDAKFRSWRERFVEEPGSAAPQAIVDALTEEDSILGWTSSNVLKRLSLSNAQVDAVVSLSTHARPVVRWRACHVMGGLTDRAAIEAMFERRKRLRRECALRRREVADRERLAGRV